MIEAQRRRLAGRRRPHPRGRLDLPWGPVSCSASSAPTGRASPRSSTSSPVSGDPRGADHPRRPGRHPPRRHRAGPSRAGPVVPDLGPVRRVEGRGERPPRHPGLPAGWALARPTGGPSRRAGQVEALLDRVRMPGRTAVPAGGLSHGDRRKLELAMALASEPTVLLLDEPMAGVSAEDVDGLTAIIGEVRDAGVAVLMVEHHMHVVLGLADRVAVLHHGRLLAVRLSRRGHLRRPRSSRPTSERRCEQPRGPFSAVDAACTSATAVRMSCRASPSRCPLPASPRCSGATASARRRRSRRSSAWHRGPGGSACDGARHHGLVDGPHRSAEGIGYVPGGP